MPIQHMLPPAAEKRHYETQPPNEAGKWIDATDFAMLNDIAKNVGVGKVAPDLEDVISIPDVWAQVVGFDSSLRDPNHPRHGRSVSEWRALIAVLAFGHKPDYSLTIAEIPSLNPPANALDATSLSFLEIAAILRPRATLGAGAEWHDLAVLNFHGTPLAFITPTFLVCPVRHHHHALVDSSVPWMAGNRLADPIKSPISPMDCAAIAKFCDDLKAFVVQSTGGVTDNPLPRRLASLLENFSLEARHKAQGTGDVQFGSRRLPLAGLRDCPLFDALREAPMVEGLPRMGTILRSRPGMDPLLKGAVIVDPEIARSFGVPATNVQLWPDIGLDSVTRGGSATAGVMARLRTEAAEGGYLTLDLDDIFADNLVSFGEARVAGHPNAPTMLMPFRPEILLFLSADDLRKATFRRHGDDWIVELTVTLADTDGGSRSHTFRRTYSPDKVKTATVPTGLATWPNFRSDQWHQHFLFFYGAEASSNALLEAAFTPKGLHQALAPLRTARAIVDAAKAICAAMVHNSRQTVNDDNGMISRTVTLDEPPEAVACRVGGQGTGTAAAGLLLFPPLPLRVSGRGEGWKIGIDFGTTNTNVYFSQGPDSIKRMIFADRVVWAFEHHDGSAEELLALQFLPPTGTSVPFMTALEHIDLQRRENPRILETDRIYFMSRNVKHTLHDLNREERRRTTAFNLKWGSRRKGATNGDGENIIARNDVLVFLAQVAMMCLAEVVDKGGNKESVSWHFSYPEAFLTDEIEDFQKMAPKAVEMTSGKEAKVTFMTESLATALYFHNHEKANFPHTVIALDIGGNTTDVSLWQSDRLVWQGSFVFAGQHTLIPYLSHSRQALNQLFGDDRDLRTMADKWLAGDGGAKSSTWTRNLVEVIVNSTWFRERMENDLASLRGEESLKQLGTLAELCLFGIFHYLGLCAAYLAKKNVLKLDHGPVHVCLGGRGSLFFKQFVSSSEAQLQILAHFGETAGFTTNIFGPHFSKDPKEEVALGLLVNDSVTGSLSRDAKSADVVLGERLYVGNGRCDALSSLSELPVGQVKTTASKKRGKAEPAGACGQEDIPTWLMKEFPEICKFLTAYQKRLGRQIGDCEALEMALITQVANDIAAARNEFKKASLNGSRGAKPEVVRHVEPPFIIALRGLVRHIIDQDVAIQRLDA